MVNMTLVGIQEVTELTHPTNDFWFTQMQRELDRRFTDVKEEMNRRFTDVDKDNSEIKRRLDRLEGAPKDSFRAYAVPVITAIITAIILSFLVSRGVVTK